METFEVLDLKIDKVVHSEPNSAGCSVKDEFKKKQGFR